MWEKSQTDMWQFSPKYWQINILLLDCSEVNVGLVIATPLPVEVRVQYLAFTNGQEQHRSCVAWVTQPKSLLCLSGSKELVLPVNFSYGSPWTVT